VTTYSAVGTAVFIVYRDVAGGFRWTLYAANSKKIADSGESYTTRSDAHEAAERVKRLAPTAPIRDKF
jgi:uncharacterized protein YegP (UPF0339 family)